MAVRLSDCEVLIPQYRSAKYYYLAACAGVILLGALLFFFGGAVGLEKFNAYASAALTAIGLAPFIGFMSSAQKARLLAGVQRVLARGEKISPLLEARVRKIIGEEML